MKYEPKYTSLEQYQINPPIKNNEKKFQKKNLTSNDKSLEVKNISNQKIDANSFHSVNYTTTNQPKNSKKSDHILIYSTNRINNSINKDIYHRDYFLSQPYKQDDSTSYEDSISRTNINMRLIELHPQSIDNSQNSINRLANKTNEDNRYRSNYSYYESKYTSRKRSEQDDNNRNKIVTNIKNSDNLKVYSCEDSIKNIPLTRNYLIQENNNMIRNQKSSSSSKSKMIDSTYYQIQKDKNNYLINSSSNNNKKGPIIFKNSYNSCKNSVSPYIPINNLNIKTTIQTSTPVVLSQRKISPEKLNEKIKSIHINELTQNNTNKVEKNITSKSLEKVRIKKLIYNQHNQPKSKNTIKYKKKIDINEEKRIPNLIKPFELDLEKPSLSSRETKLNSQSKNKNKVLNINKNNKNNNNKNNIIIISSKDINDSNSNNKNNNLILNKNYNNTLNNKNNGQNNKNIKTNDNKNVINDINKKSSKANNSSEKNKTIFNMIKNNVQINSTKNNTINNIKNNTLNISRKENITKKIVNLKENNNNNTNTIRTINFNISLKPLLQEHLKTQINEVKTKVREGRNLSNEKQKKKPMIQGIKILDSNGIKNLDVNENKKYNKILPKNKIIEISKKNTSHNKDSKENKEKNNNKKLIIKKENSERINDKNKYYKESKNIKNSNSNTNTNNNTDSKQIIKSFNKDNNISANFKKIRSEQISELKINKIKNDTQKKLYSKEKYEEKKALNNNKGKNSNIMNNITTSKMGEYKNRKNSGDVDLENKTKSINNNLKNNISNFKAHTSKNIKSNINNISNINNSNNENKRNSINNASIKTLSPKLNSSSKVVEPISSEDKSTQKTNINQSDSLKNRNIHNRIICSPKKANKKEEKEDEWDKMQYMGMAKRTYDPSLRQAKKGKLMKNEKKTNSLKAEFSSTIYVKSSEGLSIPGKSENGLRKTNQDTLLIERNVNGVLNFNIFGVLDGHGEDGHFVSKFVSRFIFNKLKSHPLIKKLDEPKQIYYKLKENGYEIIANIFLDADVQIQKEKFDFHRSGTTCVIVIQLEEHIICANTGDSRAIAVFDENYDDNLMDSKVYPLSYDCKPELPNELMRIIEYGGVVDKVYDVENPEIGPFRVWAKGKDYPGLAMSRSIGDMDAKKVGVIPNPQIVEYTIDYYSKYLILASDGIWEFISSEQAMKYCNKFYMRNDAKGLCQDLTQKATALWEKNDCCIDDITVIVVFF